MCFSPIFHIWCFRRPLDHGHYFSGFEQQDSIMDGVEEVTFY